MSKTIYINPGVLETTTADIKLAKGYSVDNFIYDVKSHCESVLLEISVLKEKHPELKKDLVCFGSELEELMDIIQTMRI